MPATLTPNPAKTNAQLVRRAKGWTQDDVARVVGIRRSYLSRVERGFEVPSPPVLWRLARTLDVPVRDLLKAPV